MSIDAQPAHGEKVRRTLMSIDSGLTVGRGPVPRQRRSHRKLPGTSVGQDRLILTCSGAGDRELQGPVSRGRGNRGGQAPRYGAAASPFIP